MQFDTLLAPVLYYYLLFRGFDHNLLVSQSVSHSVSQSDIQSILLQSICPSGCLVSKDFYLILFVLNIEPCNRKGENVIKTWTLQISTQDLA